MTSLSDEGVADPKIFGIGLARTGTSSLHSAFDLLGVRSAPTSVALMSLFSAEGQHDDDHPHLETATAFTDNPVPFLYDRLDAMCPGSKFIHTTRPKDEWLESMRWLFGPGLSRLDRRTRRLGNDVHEQLYGIRTFDAVKLGRVHDAHHRGVGEYFEGRSGDLLRIETSNLDWQPLCDFIGRSVPDIAFPHVNAAAPRHRPRLRFFSA